MRFREPFTVYPRKMKSGRIIWYYQTYDKDGRRTPSYSTGQTTKTKARAVCFELLKTDKLIPKRGGNITFQQFAADWWDWDKCDYIKFRNNRRPITRSYADTALLMLKSHILPRFGKKPLRTITSYDIEKWQDDFSQKCKTNSSANLGLTVLKIMLKEATRRGLIQFNPADSVSPLKRNSKERGIPTKDEVEKLFSEVDKNRIWDDDIYYFGNILAACTGMRISEVIGMRIENIREGYIFLDQQYRPKYGLTDLKNHKPREIVIPPFLQEQLEELAIRNPKGFLFSINSGETPVHQDSMRRSLEKAYKKIGIDTEERKERGLCFHSWRHYLNTTLRSHNITDGKLRAMV